MFIISKREKTVLAGRFKNKSDVKTSSFDDNEKSKRSRTKNHKTEDQNINLHKFSSKLESISAKHSKNAPKNIRIALQAAGADVSKHPVAAQTGGIHLRRTVIRKSSRHLIVLKKGIFILSNVPVVILTGILRAIRVMAGSLISVKKPMRSIKKKM